MTQPNQPERSEARIPMADEIEFACSWWAERWEKPETREAFRDALRSVLQQPSDPDDYSPRSMSWLLKVDYDPQGTLLEAVQLVEPECRGFMFSARGLLPGKTCMSIEPGKITASEGRRDPWHTVWERA